MQWRSGSAREDDGLPHRFEADAEVETLRCRIVQVVANLDALGAGRGKQIDAGGEDVSGQTSLLMVVFGAHGFDETGGAHGVMPEQPVGRNAVLAVEYNQVEVGSVQRSLTKAGLNVGSASEDHVMRTLHRVDTSGQPVVLMQWADLWPSRCGQPRFGHPVSLDREAMVDQYVT